MFFKKKKVSTYKKKSIFLSQLVWTLSIFIIFFLWICIVKITENINFNFLDFAVWKSPLITKVEPVIDKKRINVLILWRWWWNHDAPNLTDTIILWSLNFEKKTISMLSIPRDLFVEYPDSKRKWKINKIYNTFLYKWEPYAIGKLKEKVTEITWEKIDYYVNLDFKWFKEVIDILWWVEVTLPRNFVDDKFPDWNLGYTTFMLKKWTWNLDWEVALKYARSRHSTSDFDRSIRQQQIINAIKDKLKELWYFKDSSKIRDLFTSLEKNIKTDIWIKDLFKIWLFLKWNSVDILSFNLNDSCFYWSLACTKWWFLYVPLKEYFNNLSVLLPEWANKNNISNYEVIKLYSNNIFNAPEVFKNSYKINIFNSTKTKFLARWLADELKKYWFNVPSKDSIWNIKNKEFEKSVLYYNNIEENTYTINAIKKIIDIEVKEVDAPLYSKYEDVKIEIILWEDHEVLLKNINF